mgnify:FL=1
MVTIKDYEEKYRNQVIALILYIQNIEGGVNLSLKDQPDLNDINACYRDSGGGFWIAVNDDDRVVGTLGLINKNGICGILKKFFIEREFRGGEKDVSAGLFERLLEHARRGGMKQIVLDTPAVCLRAHGFYRKKGFRRIGKEQLPVQYDYPDRDSWLFLKELV